MKKKIGLSLTLLSGILLTSCGNKTYGTLVLNANGGTFSDGTSQMSIKGVSGKKVENQENYSPTMSGKDVKFRGWFENAEIKGKSVDLVYPYLVTYNLYAGWAEKVVISYIVGSDKYETYSGYQGETFELAEYETEDIFYGWFFDAEFKERCSLTSLPEKDTTLYGKVEENPSINLHYSETNVVQYKAKAGIKLEENFDVPSKDGSKFVGWFTESGSQFYFDYMPGATIDLYPKFVKEVTISFEANGGTAVSSLNGYQGEKITQDIEISTKENHYLEGWYTDSSLTNRFSFDTFPNENTTLYAKWTIYPKLSFTYEGTTVAETYDDIYLPSGKQIPELPKPSLTGYNFLGWFTSNESGGYDIFTNKFMPSTDVVLVGRFEKHRMVKIITQYAGVDLNSKDVELIQESIDGEWWSNNYQVPVGYVQKNIYTDSVDKTNLILLPYNPISDVTIVVDLAKIVTVKFYNGSEYLYSISGGEGMTMNIETIQEHISKPGFTVEGFYEDAGFLINNPMKVFPTAEKTGESLELNVYVKYFKD
ncbi:MAG TPA: hypothetical protein DCY93_04080 [Firmicutes bacterium]|nr:hypothetical protein [Bacillota bacterium]